MKPLSIFTFILFYILEWQSRILETGQMDYISNPQGASPEKSSIRLCVRTPPPRLSHDDICSDTKHVTCLAPSAPMIRPADVDTKGAVHSEIGGTQLLGILAG
ncbi:hypothetical protein Micbo1qcDRAFT_159404, partial [Microdochium bolleyi]